MSRRNVAVSVALAVIAVLNFAESLYAKAEFLLHWPHGEAVAMRWVTNLDIWLLEHNIEPVFAGLFLAVVLSGWIVPDVWPFLRKRWAGDDIQRAGQDKREPSLRR